MSAFFFGPENQQLFGYHHPPRGAAGGAVVVCAPWGLEYQYSHRALRVLAQRLAERGHHVLRFDHSGAGDSWGETSDVDLEVWRDDLLLAIREARRLSGRPSVDLVGLRLGAVVASRAAAAEPGVGRLVLWDPVVEGAGWLAEIAERVRRPVPPPDAHGATVEFGNMVVSPRFLGQIRAVGPHDFAPQLAERVLLLETREEAARDSLAARLAHVRALEPEIVPDVSPWIEDVAIWGGQIPAKAIRRITEWFRA